MDPKYGTKLRDLDRRVLEQRGALPSPVRQAAAHGDVPEDAAAYVDKVRRHAYRVTDGDVQGLLAAGYSQDQVFELTIAAAYGAARRRLDAGLDAMGGGEPTEQAPRMDSGDP